MSRIVLIFGLVIASHLIIFGQPVPSNSYSNLKAGVALGIQTQASTYTPTSGCNDNETNYYFLRGGIKYYSSASFSLAVGTHSMSYYQENITYDDITGSCAVSTVNTFIKTISLFVVSDLTFNPVAAFCVNTNYNLQSASNYSDANYSIISNTAGASNGGISSSWTPTLPGSYTIRASRAFTNGTTNVDRTIIVYSSTGVSGLPALTQACPIGEIFLSATASGGTGTYVYAWQVSVNNGSTYTYLQNNLTYSGVSTNQLRIETNNTLGSGNKYRLEVTSCGSTFSSVTTLNFYGSVPINTALPTTISRCVGSPINLTADATPRFGAIHYTWEYNTGSGWFDSGVSSATLNDLVIDHSWNNRKIRYIATDDCGNTSTTTSAEVTLTVYEDVVTTDPIDKSVCSTGSTVTFSVSATGQGPYTYQWLEDGVNLVNSSAYTNVNSGTLGVVNPTLAYNNKKYSCRVAGLCGTVLSNEANLTVSAPPTITNDPASVAVCNGANTSFTVSASGSSLVYSWQYSPTGGVGTFNAIANTNSATLSLVTVTTGMAGYYQVAISNTNCSSVFSTPAQLIVNPITSSSDPVNKSTCPDGSVSLSVTATGTSTIIYQWQKATSVAPTVFTNISGATSNILQLTNLNLQDSGDKYRCIVNSSCGSDITTQAATVTVNPIPLKPVVSNVARCGPGALSALAATQTPDPSAIFKWYNDPSDVSPIFTGSEYTISNLLMTAVRYVSVTQLTCESEKQEVIFTLNPIQDVPLGNPLNLCIAQGTYNLENDIGDEIAKGNNFTWAANGTNYSSIYFDPSVGEGTYIVNYDPPTISKNTPYCYQPTTRTVTVIVGGGDGGIIFANTTNNTINACVGNDPIILSDLPSLKGGTWAVLRGTGLSYNGDNAIFTPDQNSFTASLPNQFRYDLILNGCAVSKQLEIYVKDNINVPNVSGLPLVVCPDAPINLVATVSSPGSFTYEWKKAGVPDLYSTASTLSYIVQQTETLELRSLNTFGCRSEAKMVNIVTPFGSAAIIPNKSIIEVGDNVKFVYDVTTAGNTYNWNFGDQSSGSIEKDPVHYYYKPGEFTVELTVTSTLGCSRILQFEKVVVNGEELVIITGDSDVNVTPLSYYPNPIQNRLVVELPQRAEVTIINTIGQKIFTASLVKGSNAVDLSRLTSGMYYMAVGGKFYRIIKD